MCNIDINVNNFIDREKVFDFAKFISTTSFTLIFINNCFFICDLQRFFLVRRIIISSHLLYNFFTNIVKYFLQSLSCFGRGIKMFTRVLFRKSKNLQIIITLSQLIYPHQFFLNLFYFQLLQ